MTQTWHWPPHRLVVSAIDAYTGERLVLHDESGVRLAARGGGERVGAGPVRAPTGW